MVTTVCMENEAKTGKKLSQKSFIACFHHYENIGTSPYPYFCFTLNFSSKFKTTLPYLYLLFSVCLFNYIFFAYTNCILKTNLSEFNSLLWIYKTIKNRCLKCSNHIIQSLFVNFQESFSLFNASKWLKGIVKGDSMLFLYRMNVSIITFHVLLLLLLFLTRVRH